jgi:hypothetical protein
MNTVITFNAYSKSVTAYRIHGAYKVVDTTHNTTPAAELGRILGLDDNAFYNEYTKAWTDGAGNHIADSGDTSADMGDYTIIACDLSEITDTDIEMLKAMRKDAYTRDMAAAIEGTAGE